MLRRIFRIKRNEERRKWKRLHHENLLGLYSLPNIIRVTKSGILRWAGHVARMGDRRGAYRVLVGKPERRKTH